MVDSWYLTHATKNVVWIFTLPFFLLFCRGKCKDHAWANMKTKSMLNAYAWWCNDSCKMWGWNMITNKCRNDMFIMMPWRDAYAMHDMNAFTDTRARKIISPYLRIWGHNAPCVQLRRRYGSSDFPRQQTRPTYNACATAWCRCAKAQQGDLHSMAISSNNHTTKAYMTFRLHAWRHDVDAQKHNMGRKHNKGVIYIYETKKIQL